MDNVRQEAIRLSLADVTWAEDAAKVMHEPGLDLTPSQVRTLTAYYGMPPGSDLRRVKFQGDELAALWGKRWHGYQANGLGIVSGAPVPPFVVVGDERLQLYLLRVGRHDTALYVEMVWRPQDRQRISLGGLEYRHTAADVKRAYGGLALLRKIIRPGRPPGTGTFENASEFKKLVGSAIRALRKQGRAASEENVADFFSNHTGFPACDDRQLRRWLKNFGYSSWQSLLQEIPDREYKLMS